MYSSRNVAQTTPQTVPGETVGLGAEVRNPRSKKRRPVHLVTADESLWPLVADVVSTEFLLTHVDSIEQLLGSVEPGHAGVIIWDGRGNAALADRLTELYQQSARMALIVLAEPAMASQTARLVQDNQVVACVTLPLEAPSFNDALVRAWEDVEARTALLGSAPAAGPNAQGPRKTPVTAILAGAVLAAVTAALAYHWYGSPSPTLPRAAAPAVAVAPTPELIAAAAAPAAARPVDDDAVDVLLEKAAQAMRDRRYIDPADDSALGYFRHVLAEDSTNAEAQQGLDRLEGLLVAKAATALDQRSFEVALQSMETARTLNPSDPRLRDLDARLDKMRSELGATAIQAALNAGNYARAGTLIDEAAQAKVLPVPQIAKLRDDLRLRSTSAEVDRCLSTARLRVQQDRLIDPAGDSAAHWFALAEKAGASPAMLAAGVHEFGQHLTAAARTAIEQNRSADAERLLAEARLRGVPAATLADLQNAADAAAQRGRKQAELPRLAALVSARLTSGALLDPPDDSALFYLKALKASDPQDSAIAPLTQSLQRQLLDAANALLTQNRVGDAQRMVTAALTQGPSPEADSISERIAKLTPAPVPATAERKPLKPIVPKFPLEAAERGQQGWVELKFNLLPNGRTSGVRVIDSSPHSLFDAAARDAVVAARYEPAPSSAPQVPVESKIRLTFKLDAR